MSNRFFVMAILLTILLAAAATPAVAVPVDNKDYIDEVVAPETYLENASYKLVRGITNMVTSPAEIPKQIVVTTRDRGAIGPVLGLFKGVGMTVMRIGFGAWETVSFLLPNSLEGDFAPILKPEYVWNTSEPTRR
ncbi:exosortase system-associated protein, TIGR04073 family [Trichloromonas sp.]|uniref:exosortase system-associated protein, TIGR04073 family n=1 Tax=Trichloromonas sp. TaxID=3069249 RepID=UPI003D816628